MATRSIEIAAAVVLALIIGVGTAVVRTRLLVDINDIRIGPWRSSSLIGSPQASPYLRAVVAVNGILALHRQEALYFNAATDDEGGSLVGSCRYQVIGSDIPARWWSLTAYGSDRFLIPNPAHRYSVTKNTVGRDANGDFSVFVGQEFVEGDGIATGPDRFTLMLRAYDPDPRLDLPTGHVSFPRIVRKGCP